MQRVLLSILFVLLLFSCQSKISSEKDIDYVSESSLAPNSVMVLSEIENITDTVFEVKILKTLKYGSSTPRLKDKSLKLRLPKNVKIKTGENVTLILGSEMNEESMKKKVNWGLIKILNEGN